MRVGKKLFPYPVINNSEKISSFKNSSFSLVYEDASDDENLILKDAHLVIDDLNLINLMAKGMVKGALIIECSATIYRVTKEIDLENRDIIIPLSELNDKVYISSFLYATDNITDYKSENFLDDYEDYSFNIEKYDILAADDGFFKTIEYEQEEDQKNDSIFSVIKTKGIDNMVVDYNQKKVIIKLPENEHGLYYNLRFNKTYQPLFLSMMAIPALSSVLQKFKDQDYDIDDIADDYYWFNAILVSYENIYNKKLTNEDFREIDSLTLSQILLNNSTIDAINKLFRLDMSRKMGVMTDDE